MKMKKPKKSDIVAGLREERKQFEESGRTWFDNMRGGRSVSLDFFKRNGWLLASILIVVLSLMGLRYRTQTRMVEIQKLEEKLKKAESEKLSQKKEYMTLIRQTRMNELVREHHLPLIHQEQPPYEIVDDNPIEGNKTY